MPSRLHSTFPSANFITTAVPQLEKIRHTKCEISDNDPLLRQSLISALFLFFFRRFYHVFTKCKRYSNHLHRMYIHIYIYIFFSETADANSI